MNEGREAPPPRRFRSVLWRIMRWHLPLLAVLLAVVLYWQANLIGDSLQEARRASAKRELALATAAVHGAMESQETHQLWERIRDHLPPQAAGWLEIVNLQGKVLYATDPEARDTVHAITEQPCASCHDGGDARGQPMELTVEEGDFLYSVAPLLNVPACARCHEDDGEKLGMVFTRQSMAPVHDAIRATNVGLLLAGVLAFLIVAVTTRLLFNRYLGRPLRRLAHGARAIGRGELDSRIELQDRTELTLLADTLNDSAARLEASLRETAEQRDNLKTLYYIADQLGRGIEPDVMRRRAVELASTIFKTRCVLLVGHFDEDSGAFRGTVTYHAKDDRVVERRYPDPDVAEAAPFYDPDAVERWLKGDLEEETRTRGGATVAFPLQRHGRRLGLILAPATANGGARDDRATAAHPDVVKAWLKHLGVALELSQLQRERLRQERLAAIGETVAGLSHCLKNTLNGLQGGQYVVERALEDDNCQVLAEGWRMTKNGIRRIESLSHDLLLFAGDRPLQLKPVDPHEVLEEVRDLVEDSAAARGVDLRLDCAEERAKVPLDRHAMHRAVLNLVTNAIDACTEGDEDETGGLVVLKCRYGPDRVVISVEDDGVGIPEANLPRVTDRFFTTKATLGTGLGLPVVVKIADQHGGTLEIESKPGEGSAFRIHLPVEPPEEDASDAPAEGGS